MEDLSRKDNDVIRKELSAFENNFEEIEILKSSYDNQYYIYKVNVRHGHNWFNDYIYMASNIEVVKGWLYGSVQAINGIFKPLPLKQWNK